MRLLFVGGTFDNNGGKPSGYAHKLFGALVAMGEDSPEYRYQSITYVNGGYLGSGWINDILAHNQHSPDVVVWMPNISNEEEKHLYIVKQVYKHAILVISKNNEEQRYSYPEIANKALAAHANLILEVQKINGRVYTRIFDPLCNRWTFNPGYKYLISPKLVAFVLANRINQLAACKRIGSRCVGYKIEAPQDEQFYALARDYAKTFSGFIHTADRFLGNLSFRCEHGFPAVRDTDGLVFVSRRNIDKQSIGASGMIAVDPDSVAHRIGYFGEDKPSVDAPIQVALFNRLDWAKYMLHAHAYITGAPYTKTVLPCGAMQEVDEILALQSGKFCAVNLLGHGSIVISPDIEQLRNIPYFARPIPETQRILSGQ